MQWFLDGRKNFKGPKIELIGETAIRAGEVGRAGDVGRAGEMERAGEVEVESDSSGAKNGEMVERA